MLVFIWYISFGTCQPRTTDMLNNEQCTECMSYMLFSLHSRHITDIWYAF